MDYTELLDGFAAQLRREEKSRATAEKYVHDAAAFAAFAAGREITNRRLQGAAHTAVCAGEREHSHRLPQRLSLLLRAGVLPGKASAPAAQPLCPGGKGADRRRI